MSDPGFMTITIDGKRGRVPRENAAALMKRLDEEGIPFDAADDGGGNAAPEVAPPSPPTDPTWYDALAGTTLGDIGSGIAGAARTVGTKLSDGAVGLSQGLSAGFSDELLGMLPWNSIDEQRAVVRQANERSPIVTASGQGAGAGLLGVLAAPAEGAGILANAASAGMQGAATGAGESDGDLASRVWAALAGGGMGFGLGAGMGAAGAGLSAGAEALGPLVNRAQGAAEGLSGPAFRNIAKRNGIPYAAQELGQIASDTRPPHIIPKNAEWYAEQRLPMVQEAGQAVGDTVAAATDQIPQGIPTEEFLAKLDAMRGQYARNTAGPIRRGAGTMDDISGAVSERHAGDEYMNPSDLHSLKTEWSDVGYPDKATEATPHGREQLVYQEASRIPRQELDRLILGTADEPGLALPQTQAAYANAKDDYGAMKTLQESAWDLGNMQESKSHGTLWEALAGPIRERGPDASAMALRGAQGIGRSIGNFMSGPSTIGQSAGTAAASYERVRSESKGHELERVALEALERDPASLGPYAARLQEAQQSGEPMAVVALLHEMNDDPKAHQLLFRLQAGTNTTGGY